LVCLLETVKPRSAHMLRRTFLGSELRSTDEDSEDEEDEGEEETEEEEPEEPEEEEDEEDVDRDARIR
jgi:hypothetical protein